MHYVTRSTQFQESPSSMYYAVRPARHTIVLLHTSCQFLERPAWRNTESQI